ncbi:hypothetical protein ACTID9_05145 [Brevibacillus fluminis]|uniref:hypothetical protein n=1 Tax=Brevibacillus fluminis TaxID=511487 RepID=UPI003F8B646D
MSLIGGGEGIREKSVAPPLACLLGGGVSGSAEKKEPRINATRCAAGVSQEVCCAKDVPFFLHSLGRMLKAARRFFPESLAAVPSFGILGIKIEKQKNSRFKEGKSVAPPLACLLGGGVSGSAEKKEPRINATRCAAEVSQEVCCAKDVPFFLHSLGRMLKAARRFFPESLAAVPALEFLGIKIEKQKNSRFKERKKTIWVSLLHIVSLALFFFWQAQRECRACWGAFLQCECAAQRLGH